MNSAMPILNRLNTIYVLLIWYKVWVWVSWINSPLFAMEYFAMECEDDGRSVVFIFEGYMATSCVLTLFPEMAEKLSLVKRWYKQRQQSLSSSLTDFHILYRWNIVVFAILALEEKQDFQIKIALWCGDIVIPPLTMTCWRML